MIKRIFAVALSLMLLITCTACQKSYSHIEGYDDIVNARKLYASLNSASLTVTDAEKGVITQEMSFLYDIQDRLAYSYFGTDGKTSYYEYHNGYEYSYFDKTEWKTLVEGDENYHFYTRIAKMSMVDEGMIFLKGESITDSKVTNTDKGKVIEFTYDHNALNSSMKNQLGLVGNLISFKVIYTLDSEGYLTKMEQIGKASQDDTQSIVTNINYVLEIKNMNDVSEIEKPEVILES